MAATRNEFEEEAEEVAVVDADLVAHNRWKEEEAAAVEVVMEADAAAVMMDAQVAAPSK